MSTTLNAIIQPMDRSRGTSGPLDGMRIAVKDNISTAGVRTTAGSAMLESYAPPYDATVVERILDAGGTIVGKTNMDEFGMGSTTETSAFGPTENPRAPDHVPGGSSGGSAAAIAAGLADVALGSDTGGSIRNPAAFCGVVGIKPTFGLVSRYGLIAYGHSLEQIGPLGHSVRDAAILLDIISGPDPRDATTRDNPRTDSFADAVTRDMSDAVIGIPRQLVAGADEEVRSVFWDAIDDLESIGIETQEVELPSLKHAVAAYYVLAMSEASSNLARFDGVRYGHREGDTGDWNQSFAHTRQAGFGEEVRRRILLGTFALSAGYHDKYYEQAESARALITREFENAFETIDALASPTMPTTPFRQGDALEDPLSLYIADANTVPANLANLPAVSVPIEPVNDLPVSMQFVGPQFGEDDLIALAAAVEQLG